MPKPRMRRGESLPFNGEKTIVKTCRWTQEEVTRLETAAKAKGVSVSEVIRDAVLSSLDESK